MDELAFTFERSQWEAQSERLRSMARIPGGLFLSLLEGEDGETLSEALADVQSWGNCVDISDLPEDYGTGSVSVRLRWEKQLSEKDDQLAALEKTDPLYQYLQELAQLPAAGDMELLADRLIHEEDPNVQNQLFNLCVHRVVEMALPMTGHGVLLMDLIQEGCEAVWACCTGGYDPAIGSFADCCDWWIHHYMAALILEQARASGLDRKLLDQMDSYRRVDRLLLTKLGRNPTLEEIAQEMGVTVREADSVAAMLQNARDVQPKAPSADEETEEQQEVENTAYFQSRQRVQEMLSCLDEEEAKLLTLRFGLEGGLPLNPQQAGEKLGLTPDEVLTREAGALAKLRGQV